MSSKKLTRQQLLLKILLPITLYSSFLLIKFVIGCPPTLLQRPRTILAPLLKQCLFFSDNASVTISSVAKFVTVNPRIPATGLDKQITVKFKDDCLPKNRPGVCNCLPTVSTCEIILNLPEFTRGRDDECIQRCFDL